MKNLNDQLIEKAEVYCKQLYYQEIQKMVKSFMETFYLDEKAIRNNPSLKILYDMQYSDYGGGKMLEEIMPIYIEKYVEAFINKVEELQESLCSDMKKNLVYVRFGNNYRKLKRYEKIESGAFQSWENGELQPIFMPDTIGLTPNDFSPKRDFYNPI